MIVKKQALICDLDMTLIDSGQDIAASLTYVLNRFGTHKVTVDEVLPYVGKGIQNLFDRFMPDLTVGSPRHLELMKVYQGHYKEHCADATKVFPGVRETLEKLNALGIPVAVASNKWGVISQHVCERLGIDRFFSHFQGTEKMPGKPRPDVILAACEAIGVSPENAIYVGDKVTDIVAAKRAACAVVSVTYGVDEKMVLERESPDAIIDRFQEVLKFF